jgi:hypothetical protein
MCRRTTRRLALEIGANVRYLARHTTRVEVEAGTPFFAARKPSYLSHYNPPEPNAWLTRAAAGLVELKRVVSSIKRVSSIV